MSSRAGPDIITNGLVLHLNAADPKSYPSTGTVWYDRSVNKNNGTLVNGPTFSSNNKGSIIFDGINDYINISYNSILNASTEFTVDFWFNSSDISLEQMIFSTSNSIETAGYHIEIFLNKLALQVYPSRVETFSTETLVSNTFYNAIVSYDLGSVKYYINGIPKGTANNTFTPSNVNVFFGAWSRSGLYFKGNLPLLRFYNRALTPSEILQNFNATKSRYGL